MYLNGTQDQGVELVGRGEGHQRMQGVTSAAATREYTRGGVPMVRRVWGHAGLGRHVGTGTAQNGDESEIFWSWWGRVALAGHMTTRVLHQVTVSQVCSCFVYVKKWRKKKKKKNVKNCAARLCVLVVAAALPHLKPFITRSSPQTCTVPPPPGHNRAVPPLPLRTGSGARSLRRAVLALPDVGHAVRDLHHDSVQGLGQADLATQTGPEHVTNNERKCLRIYKMRVSFFYLSGGDIRRRIAAGPLY